MGWREEREAENAARKAAWDAKHGTLLKWKEEDKGQSLEGVFVGCEEYQGEHGLQFNPQFKLEEGKLVRLVGRGILLDKLLKVTEGTRVKVVYEGKVPGKQYHMYDVFTQDADGEWTTTEPKSGEE